MSCRISVALVRKRKWIVMTKGVVNPTKSVAIAVESKHAGNFHTRRAGLYGRRILQVVMVQVLDKRRLLQGRRLFYYETGFRCFELAARFIISSQHFC